MVPAEGPELTVPDRVPPQFPPDHYLNRELSWLEFNARVLEEAADATNPWLERLKFLAIFSSNLDEFFEIRVAGLQQQVYAGVEPQDYGADGMAPAEQLAAIDRRAHELVAEQYRILDDEVLPGLAGGGVERVRLDDLTEAERRHVDTLFRASIAPVLTPLAIDPGHPFPHVHNKSLNIALVVKRRNGGQKSGRHFAVVQVPALLDRVVIVSTHGEGRVRFVLLEDIIARHLGELFGGLRVVSHTVFRVTRNTDLTIEEEDAEDLLEMIEESLRQRRRSDPVRLEISADADDAFVEMLTGAHDLEARDVYRLPGPIDLTALMTLHRLDGFPAFKDEPVVPRVAPPFAQGRDVFDVIRSQDVLVHLPYESFGCVVDFIERAADDPQVLAIKQTLYRTSGASPIISALARAAQNGKQVTALIELKARMDEQNNITWARTLERAGVHVVYGIVGLKTHCKAALVVRREGDGIRRYVHLSTGNYNPTTARVYTDLGLFTANPDMGEDASALFNLLTGYAEGYRWRKLVVAPVGMREQIIGLIEREERNAREGRAARIIVKMNALVEPSVIDALYRASQGGVAIELVVRGICCLRPGLPGVSETIRVTSIVDKYLEHSRIFYFENGGNPEVFLASADWMPRNFWRRIETLFPIEDPALQARIVGDILQPILSDTVKVRELLSDGTYRRRTPGDGEAPLRSQIALQHLAREAAREGTDVRPPFVPIVRRPSSPRTPQGEPAPA
ncbi:MAG: polyphosphate kinase 1 [Gemmatimonadetes bacterium]|nr:MAG: polyphosphate kinase 1 [Gemmatimonadota bacterium]PYP05082.1 MAG: polyphosphate kinase 1 [Gemmatimonadota bacterium]